MTTMDSCPVLYYPKHEINTKMLLEEYFSQHVPYSTFKESTINMQRCFYKAFSSGLVCGKTLIDFSIGPIIMHLISVCEFFEEISILKVNDVTIKELELWRNKDPKSFDWSQTSKLFMEIKQLNCDGWEEEEEILRGKIKEILKCDLGKDYLDTLPKFDCATSVWFLEIISKDHEDYRKNLRKINNLVKMGGYLLCYASVNTSFFKIGKDKFHVVTCDESFYKKVISEEGFEIKHEENLEKIMISGIVDHDRVMFIVAQKVREV
ncbi:nicotinamide N-methyltransferase-like [Anomaloglossus baeobatrachus]|uniref:nicotinamide N-methyltransferase-like n=1 Tax=Anomaloglossus baeobatrachus TaxID=238106 RepID=UPI003F503FEB